MDEKREIMSSIKSGLAAQINAEHHLCRDAMQSGLEHAINAGNLLLEVKAQCVHGEWQAWLAANCEFPERTAQMYMRVARGLPLLEAKAQRVADLSLRGAVALLNSGSGLSETEKAQAFGLEWDELYEEWKSVAILCEEILGKPDATLQEVLAVQKTAERWQFRWSEMHLRTCRELGRLLNDIRAAIPAAIAAVREKYPDIVMTDDEVVLSVVLDGQPEIAKMLGWGARKKAALAEYNSE